MKEEEEWLCNGKGLYKTVRKEVLEAESSFRASSVSQGGGCLSVSLLCSVFGGESPREVWSQWKWMDVRVQPPPLSYAGAVW